jgi:predicted RNA methylase
VESPNSVTAESNTLESVADSKSSISLSKTNIVNVSSTSNTQAQSSGETCEPSKESPVNSSWSLGGVLVRTTPVLTPKAKDLQAIALGCGGSISELSKSANLQSSSGKTPQDADIQNQDMNYLPLEWFSGRLKVAGIVVSGNPYELVMSGRPTKGIAYSVLPTPLTCSSDSESYRRPGQDRLERRLRRELSFLPGMVSHPEIREWMLGLPKSSTVIHKAGGGLSIRLRELLRFPVVVSPVEAIASQPLETVAPPNSQPSAGDTSTTSPDDLSLQPTQHDVGRYVYHDDKEQIGLIQSIAVTRETPTHPARRTAQVLFGADTKTVSLDELELLPLDKELTYLQRELTEIQQQIDSAAIAKDALPKKSSEYKLLDKHLKAEWKRFQGCIKRAQNLAASQGKELSMQGQSVDEDGWFYQFQVQEKAAVSTAAQSNNTQGEYTMLIIASDQTYLDVTNSIAEYTENLAESRKSHNALIAGFKRQKIKADSREWKSADRRHEKEVAKIKAKLLSLNTCDLLPVNSTVEEPIKGIGKVIGFFVDDRDVIMADVEFDSGISSVAPHDLKLAQSPILANDKVKEVEAKPQRKGSISPEVIAVLENATVEGNTIKLNSPQLDRKLYVKVNDVLERIGGKWKGGKVSAHVFENDPTDLLEAVLYTGDLPDKNPLAFFGTPSDLAHQIAEMLKPKNVADGVLEPEAGEGALALAVRDIYPDAQVDCVEIDLSRANKLRALGFNTIEGDFLQLDLGRKYRAIVMNPPFSVKGDSLAYITHIEKAFSLLEDGGQLIAIAPSGLAFNNQKRVQEFRGLILDYGDWDDLEAGAFASSGTNVSAVLLSLEKPSVAVAAVEEVPEISATAQEIFTPISEISGNFQEPPVFNETTSLAIAQIRRDGGTQTREKLDLSHVATLVEALEDGNEFDPAIVFYDGTDYWLGDGFHRCQSKEDAGHEDILVIIHQGTRRDAVLYSCGANATHKAAKPRTRADKRRAVLMLLNDPEWKEWSSKEIARRCKVSDFLVNQIREELTARSSGENSSETEVRRYTTRHDTEATMQVKPKAAKPANETPRTVQPLQDIGFVDKADELPTQQPPATQDYLIGFLSNIDQLSAEQLQEAQSRIIRKLGKQQNLNVLAAAVVDNAHLFSAEESQRIVEALGYNARVQELESRVLELEGQLTAEGIKPKQKDSSPTVEWYTPPEYIEMARQVLGTIDLDPASNDLAQSWIKATKYFTKDDDGFSEDWAGNVWCNPPYGRDVEKWLIKAIHNYNSGRIKSAILLLNNTRAAWYKAGIKQVSAICEVHKRIAFIDENGERQSSPRHSNDFLYLGEDVDKFIEVFSGIGDVRVMQPELSQAA